MPRHLHVCGLCRGPSHAFVAVRVRGVAGVPTVRARKACTACPVPCAACELQTHDARALVGAIAAASRAWVVALPLIFACTIELVDEEGVVVACATVPALGSRVASRLLTLTRPALAALMRASLDMGEPGRARAHLVWGAPASMADPSQSVWRLTVAYPTDETHAVPELHAFDVQARQVRVSPLVLEDHVVPAGPTSALMERVVTFSCTLPAEVVPFYVEAGLSGASHPVLPGFAVVFAQVAARMVGEATQAATAVIDDGAYGAWLAARRASPGELAAQAQAAASDKDAPEHLVSLVVTVCDPACHGLGQTVASLLAQSHAGWELVMAGPHRDAVAQRLAREPFAADPRLRIVSSAGQSPLEAARAGLCASVGALVMFLRVGDVLEPDALWHLVRALVAHDADAVYCDEDVLGEDGSLSAPTFRGGASLGRLYSHNYVGHALLARRSALEGSCVAAAAPDDGIADAWDHDVALAAFGDAHAVAHVPRVLLHARAAEPGACEHEAGMRVLERHLARRGLSACVSSGPQPGTYRVRLEHRDGEPLVSVIIPNRDHAELLAACVGSLLGRTDYPRYEVVIVENGSTDPGTFALYSRLCGDGRVRVVAWEPPEPGAFNYSAVVNAGAAAARGDALLLLNNDAEVVDGSWMRELVAQLARPEVGVVGARLVFPDGLLQHAGIVANARGEFMHANGSLPADAPGYGHGIDLPADVEMVSGACQLVRRSVFDELGGYDEGFAVGYNDGDFCLRARRAGHVVAYCPYATLVHREFASRGRESADVRLQGRYLSEHARFVLRHADALATHAICHNPSLAQDSPLPRLSDV